MEMSNMIKVILDGSSMKNREMVHIYLKQRLKTPEYHGENLDALWDVLSSYSEPIEIELKNEEKLIENLGNYGQSLIRVFKDAGEKNENINFKII